MSTPASLAHVHGTSVYVGDLCVGSVLEVFAARAGDRVIGLEVSSPDGRRWFVPWVACSLEPGRVLSSSPLLFLPEQGLDFYARKAVRLSPSDLARVLVSADGRLGAPGDGSGGGVFATLGEGTQTS